jgi:hypothetical protein
MISLRSIYCLCGTNSKDINIDFKPHINNALDIYSKRVQIENAMKSAIKDAAEHKVFRV